MEERLGGAIPAGTLSASDQLFTAFAEEQAAIEELLKQLQASFEVQSQALLGMTGEEPKTPFTQEITQTETIETSSEEADPVSNEAVIVFTALANYHVANPEAAEYPLTASDIAELLVDGPITNSLDELKKKVTSKPFFKELQEISRAAGVGIKRQNPTRPEKDSGMQPVFFLTATPELVESNSLETKTIVIEDPVPREVEVVEPSVDTPQEEVLKEIEAVEPSIETPQVEIPPETEQKKQLPAKPDLSKIKLPTVGFQVLKIDERGKLAVDTIDVILRRKELAQLPVHVREQLFRENVNVIADAYLQGDITDKELSILYQAVARLDRTKDKYFFTYALEELPVDKFEMIVPQLPNHFMIALDMIDIETCTPSRIAAYIRHFASLVSASKRFDFNRKQNGLEEKYQDEAYARMHDLLTAIVDRIQDPVDRLTEYDIVEMLPTRNSDGEIPKYVLNALFELEERDDSIVETLIRLIRTY